MSSFDEIIGNRTICSKTREPFRVCSVCELAIAPEDYFVIAKAFQDGKILLEAVQCFSCQNESQSYASEQSLENIMLYSGRRFNAYIRDPIERKLYHLEEPSCLITGEELQIRNSFELYHFNIPGVGLGEDNFVLVGPTAIEQMSDLLSKETRESWGRFTEQLIPDSPELVISPMFFG